MSLNEHLNGDTATPPGAARTTPGQVPTGDGGDSSPDCRQDGELPEDTPDSPEDQEAADADGTQPQRRLSMAARLVEMARACYSFGIADTGEVFACHNDTPHVAMLLKGGKRGLQSWLAAQWFDDNQTVASGQALHDALNVLEGYARRQQPSVLHQRVAEHGGRVYLDTADEHNRVIVIDDGAWSIVESAPVLFRRTNCTLALSERAPQGDLDRIWGYLNVEEADRPLLLAYMVAAVVQERVPHTILTLLAEHGSAKTTTAKVLVSLLDPSPAPTRTPPTDADAWRANTSASWVVAFDNLSTVSAWLSDAMCRAATGDAMVKRALHTDSDLSVISLRRCLILTGIDLGALAGDLSDRAVTVSLRRITNANRRSEEEFWSAWEHDRPAVLTGLLDLAAKVHRMLPAITVPGGMLRMADYSKVLACLDQLWGISAVTRYRSRHDEVVVDSLNSAPLVGAIVRRGYRCEKKSGTQILEDLAGIPRSRGAMWPRTGREVTSQLTRNSEALRILGWEIDNDGKRNKHHTTLWTITPPQQDPKLDSPNSPRSSGQVIDGFSGELGREHEASPRLVDAGEAKWRANGRVTDNGSVSSPDRPLTCGDELGGRGERRTGGMVCRCRFCADQLSDKHCIDRGYCTKPECSNSARQLHGRPIPTPGDVARMRRPQPRTPVSARPNRWGRT